MLWDLRQDFERQQHPVNPAYGILIKSGKDPTVL